MGFGETGFGETGFGETGFGETGFGETGFGEMGFGETGFGETGFGETGGHQPIHTQLATLSQWYRTGDYESFKFAMPVISINAFEFKYVIQHT